MRLVLALSLSGLTLSLNGCVLERWLIETETRRDPVPVQYLTPTPTPPPPRRIDQCPLWGEELKAAIAECNADKASIEAWANRNPEDSD